MSKIDCPFTGIIEETARALELNGEIGQAIDKVLALRRPPPPAEKPEGLPPAGSIGETGPKPKS